MDVIVVSDEVIQMLTTTMPPGDKGNLTIAWVCTVVACLGFGSNYLPVKKCDTRDGQFFSLMVACGIFLVGLIQWIFFGVIQDGFYKFEPIAMLGGVIWASGNLFVPFIVQRLGLGVGQLVWGATNMLTGWATGMFGLFGVEQAGVEHRALNFIGVGIAVLALGVFTQMGVDKPAKVLVDEADPERHNVSGSFTAPLTTEEPAKKTASGFGIGFVVALAAGVLFGSNFDPPTILEQQGFPNHSTDSMHYVISHFTGVLAFTVVAFVAFKLLSPSCYIGTDVVLPGLIAGVLWGIAQVCWFYANAVLSYVVAFPIIVGVPGVIAALWGVVLFGENRSQKNMSLLGVIIVLQGISLVCIATSKGNAQ